MTSYTLYISTAYTHHGELLVEWLWTSYMVVYMWTVVLDKTKCGDCSIRVYWSLSLSIDSIPYGHVGYTIYGLSGNKKQTFGRGYDYDYDCIQGWGWEACTPVQLHTIMHK